MAYDRGITVFSPDGRLFQVEYAREAVKKGSTTIGLKYKDGVALIVDKRSMSKLLEPKSTEKIHDIDDFIGCATSGLVADARMLVDEARKEAQNHRVIYGENISVEVLVKKVCDYKQQFTQYGGARPFGTALLVVGTDDLGVHLFETDPSGALVAYKATGIGSGRAAVMEMFEKEYKDDMPFNTAMKLGLKALESAIEERPNPETVEIGVAEVGKKFRRLSEKEVEALLKKDEKKPKEKD
jgi:proteasome alpha subunit